MPKKHRLRWWLGPTALALVVLGAIDALAPGQDDLPDDVLFTEDFEGESIRFPTDNDRFVDMRVVEGAYRVEITDGTNPQLVRHVFSHTYDSLSFRATIVRPADADGEVFASVGCWASDSAYLLVMGSDGDVGLVETVSEQTGERRPLTDLTPSDATHPAGEPDRLRIDCVGGGQDPTVVSGYVNGEPVLSVEIADGYDSFSAVGFFMVSANGGTFTIDDATATSERPEPGMSPVPPRIETAAEPPPASASCDEVFEHVAEAFDADRGTDALDITGFEAPMACATLAEAEASATAAMGKRGARGLEDYLARSCAYVGPSAGISETDLCREVLSKHPELT
jgi:hypothetical protein